MTQSVTEKLALDAEIVKAYLERQSKIKTIPNPLTRQDYLCKLKGCTKDGGAKIWLRYVPGKLLLQKAAFDLYLNSLPATKTLESLAAMLLDDFNNELVAKFIQVRIEADPDSPDADHEVLIEDRSPRWDNKALLARLGRF